MKQSERSSEKNGSLTKSSGKFLFDLHKGFEASFHNKERGTIESGIAIIDFLIRSALNKTADPSLCCYLNSCIVDQLKEARLFDDSPGSVYLAMEAEFARDLDILRLFYEDSLENMDLYINLPYVQGVGALYSYLLSKSRTITRLRNILRTHITLFFEYGGQRVLEELGVDGEFKLKDSELLSLIEEKIDRLIIGDHSLLLTTAREVVWQVEKQKELVLEEERGIKDAIGKLVKKIIDRSRWVGRRILGRASKIAGNEGVRNSRDAVIWGFAKNGVSQIIFVTKGDDRVESVCEGLDKKVYNIPLTGDPTSAIPSGERIPVHMGCRCTYLAVPSALENFHAGDVWTGG